MMRTIFGQKRATLQRSNSGELHVQSDAFAKLLVDLEEELDCSPKLRVIQNLIDLYGRAVEYYEFNSNPRYIHYQERLSNLLSRKDVISVILNPSSPTNSVVHRVINRKSNLGKEGLKTHRSVESSLKAFYTQTNSSTSLLQSNLKEQCSGLETRLQIRKNEMGRRNSAEPKCETESAIVISDSSAHSNQSDHCGGISETEHYENQLENILEHYLEKKLNFKRETKEKYNTQIAEIQQMGKSTVLETLIQDLRRKSSEEVDRQNEILETKKKQEINSLKKTYNK